MCLYCMFHVLSSMIHQNISHPFLVGSLSGQHPFTLLQAARLAWRFRENFITSLLKSLITSANWCAAEGSREHLLCFYLSFGRRAALTLTFEAWRSFDAWKVCKYLQNLQWGWSCGKFVSRSMHKSRRVQVQPPLRNLRKPRNIKEMCAVISGSSIKHMRLCGHAYTHTY